MRFLMALLLVLVPIPASVAQTKPADTEKAEQARQAKMLKAVEKLRRGQSADALESLDPVLADYDKLHPASGPRVVCADDIGSALMGLASAAADKKDAVAVGPTWCDALWARGFALVSLGRLEEAIAPLERATAMMPSNPQYLSELAFVYQSQKRFDQSLSLYTRAAEAAETLTNEAQRKFELRRAWFGMAFAQIEFAKLDEAELLLNKALTVAPGDQNILSELDYVRELRKKGKAN